MDALKKTGKPSTKAKIVKTPVLRKILFPEIKIRRELDREGLLPKSKRSAKLEQETSAAAAATSGQSGKVYTAIRFELSAIAESTEDEQKVLEASLTCLAYFEHSEGVSQEEASEWIENNGAKVIHKLGIQVYGIAVLELERLISGTGLPPLKFPLQMPSFSAADKANSGE